MAYGRASRVVVLVHRDEPPGDDEWGAYVDFMMDCIEREGVRRVLVVSEGGAPTPRQRALMDRRCEAFFPGGRTGIVTQSTFVRGVVNAFALIRPGYRAFAPTQLENAVVWLGVDDERERVIALLLKLRRELGLG